MKNTFKQYKWSLIFIFSFFLELALHTIKRKMFGVYFSPVVIGFSVFTLCYAAHRIYQQKRPLLIRNNSSKYKLFYLSTYAFLAFAFAFVFSNVIANFPIDSNYSDVIPTLKYYTTRVLAGENVYAPIQYDGWVVHPNYLTFQWFPFLIAEILNFDYRYVALGAFYLATSLFIWKSAKTSKPKSVLTFVKLILPFIYLWLFRDYYPSVFGYTVELLIAAYYMFFAWSLFSKSYIPLIFGISLCLFSRFSFLFWLPFLALFIVQFKTWKPAIKIVSGVFVFGLLAYVIPFMLKDPFVFFRGMQYYADAAVGEWVIKAYQNDGEYPEHLGKGIGFAVYFYDFYSGTLEEKVAACRHLHLFLSVFSALVLCGIYWWRRKEWNLPFYALLSLKIYFVFFYSFIHVPYLYLQIVPLALSLVVFYQTNLFVASEKAQLE